MLSLVEHLFVKKNPLQNLLSSLNALISTNERNWILTDHVILSSVIIKSTNWKPPILNQISYKMIFFNSSFYKIVHFLKICSNFVSTYEIRSKSYQENKVTTGHQVEKCTTYHISSFELHNWGHTMTQPTSVVCSVRI